MFYKVNTNVLLMNISVLFTKPITNGASACCRCSWPKAKRAAKRAYQPSLSPAHLSSTCLFATCFAEEVHKLCDIERNVLILMPGAPFGTAVNGFGLFLTDLDPRAYQLARCTPLPRGHIRPEYCK